MQRLTIFARMLAALAMVALAVPSRAQSLPPSVAPSAAPELRGHGGPVRALAALADGRLASASFDSTIIIWDLKRGQAVHVLRQHETAVNALVAPPDGCLISGGDDARIRIWCETNGPDTSTLTGHVGPVSALAVTTDGRIVSGSWDKTVRLWDASDTGRVVAEHSGAVTSVLVTAGAVLSTSQDGTVKLTPLVGTAPPRQLKLETPITSAALKPDGRFLLACADGSVRETDAQLGSPRTLHQLDGPLTAIAVAPDGRTAATGGLRTPVTLIDLTSAAAPPAALAQALPFWAMIYARNGREIFSGGNDRTVRRFDAVSGRPVDPTIPKAAAIVVSEPNDRGARVFRACAVCHGLTATDTHLAGPTLHQIMGRRIGSKPGYAYSAPFAALDITWTPETIARLFEVGPTVLTPGSKMPEQRLTDPADRQALVDWLTRVTVP